MHGRPSPGEEKGPAKAPEASDAVALKVSRAAQTSPQSNDGRKWTHTSPHCWPPASFHAAAMNRCLLPRRVKDNPILSVTRFRLQPVASTETWTGARLWPRRHECLLFIQSDSARIQSLACDDLSIINAFAPQRSTFFFFYHPLFGGC